MLQRIITTFALIATATAMASQSSQPLPPNYKTVFENSDILVMRVHYGSHEFVPMHDHSAFTTVYVYLNDSGIVRIDHEDTSEPPVNRPPTHTGAFRISPGVAERHSVTNLDEKPSDFLRVELKRIPPEDVKNVFRGQLPNDLKPGKNTEFKDVALQVERVLCTQATACIAQPESARSLLVAITPAVIKLGDEARPANWRCALGSGEGHSLPETRCPPFEDFVAVSLGNPINTEPVQFINTNSV